MSEEKRNDTPDPVLAAAAVEELADACAFGWLAASKVTPWGDAYEGITAAGESVTIERTYVWADAAGGDVLCEVLVYRDGAIERGAKASRLMRRT